MLICFEYIISNEGLQLSDFGVGFQIFYLRYTSHYLYLNLERLLQVR